MRVALVTANFPPQRSAGANRLAAMARAFRDRGVAVNVFAARFAGDDPLEDRDDDLIALTTWVATRTERRRNFVVRFIDEWIIARAVLKGVRAEKFDFVVISMPILGFLLLAPFVVPRRKLVVDVRDLTWEYRISGSLPVRSAQRLLAIWSIWSLRAASLVVTATEAEKEYVEARLPNARVVHVANGIERDALEQLSRCSASFPAGSARQTVMYAGALGRAQGVAILADVAKRLPNWQFEIIGDGAEADFLRRAKTSENLMNLELVGPLPRAQVLAKYTEAAVLFARLRAGFATAVPSKIYEYLATNRPIVYMGGASDAAWRVLSQFDGTYRADDDDAESLARAIEVAHARGAPDMDTNLRLLQTYTRESQSGRLIERLEAMSGCAV
jgi:glycosyltransferase involved in cell wall biosynthesis